MKKTFLSAFASTLALLITSFQTSAQEPVDLGLSVMWATTNLGASEPYEEGGHFAWGEIMTKRVYSLEKYKFSSQPDGRLTKYNCQTISGETVDYEIVLEEEDDAARQVLGEGWRIPTLPEWEELKENCKWVFSSVKDSKGQKVYGYRVSSKKNNNSIFLPVVGSRIMDEIFHNGSFYWTSCVFEDACKSAWSCYFDSKNVGKALCDRINGLVIRPVFGKPQLEVMSSIVPVLSISLDRTSLEITDRQTPQLKATFTPSNASAQTVYWHSSNNSVVTVSDNGILHPVANGTAVITAQIGGKSAECRVTVRPRKEASSGSSTTAGEKVKPTPEAVDLGLSVKWASANLEAQIDSYLSWALYDTIADESDMGRYFAWGETVSKEQFGHERYKWEHSDKYKQRNRLDPADDAARVILGDKWHIPDFKEWKELIDNCTWTWEIKENGMEGYRVESKINQKSIFIPAGRPWGNLEPKGVYWSSVKKGDSPIVLTIDRNRHGLYITPGACWGHSIRPVCD